MIILMKIDGMNVVQAYTSLSIFKRQLIIRKRGIMFKYRVEFTDDNTAEVTASRDTIILMETLIRYGIVKKITVKS